jgi:uncharacterized protein YuzE
LIFKPLKWTEDNFEFYYQGDNIQKFSEFNSEIYNKKFRDLLDNDKILCYNFNVLKEQWEWLKNNRVTFRALIEKELEFIYNEIVKADNVFNFFEWYLKQSGQCYINIIDQKLLEFSQSNDTVVVLVNLNGDIIGVLLPDGTIGEYNPDNYTEDTDLTYITVATTDSTITNIPQEMDFCGNKEVTLEEKEYDFC